MTQVGAASRDSRVSAGRALGVAPLRRPAVIARVKPIRAPFPDVSGHVVQPVARWPRTRRPGRCRSSRRPPSCGLETGPARRSSGALPRAPAHRPTDSASRRILRVPRTPTRPRSEAAAAPRRRRPRHRATRHVRRGDRVCRRSGLRTLGIAPSGTEDLTPPRCVDDAARIGKAVRQQAREHERPAVALGIRRVARGVDEVGEAAIGDRWASIANGPSSTSRTGPSPSSRNPSASSVPIEKPPPSSSTRPHPLRLLRDRNGSGRAARVTQRVPLGPERSTPAVSSPTQTCRYSPSGSTGPCLDP